MGFKDLAENVVPSSSRAGSMKAIIFGGNGQDGHYLRAQLEARDVDVVSVSRTRGDFQLDVSDAIAVEKLLDDVRPELVFNFAATSSTSHDHLWANHAAICTGSLVLLDIVDRKLPNSKVFLAGSGLQFVNTGDPISEACELDHSSGYCIARNHALFAGRYFRARDRRIYFGFLFNHDSPHRSSSHLNMKIAEAAARASVGLDPGLKVGDLKAEKEFNSASDIIAAVIVLMSQEDIFEFVIGSGVSHPVQRWVELCYGYVGLDWKKHVSIDSSYESPYRKLVSDPTRLRSLGWKPSVSIEQLAQEMMIEAIRRVKNCRLN